MEKFKNLLKNKDKKIENLISFLVILIITLIIINTILKDDKETKKDYSDAVLAATSSEEAISTDLETRLQNILSKIDGVGEVSVLVTYSQSSQIVPMYNETASKSITEETDTSGGKRTIESEDNQKSVVTGSDSNPITRMTVYPKIEGAVVTAEGASNVNVKANIVSAVEAVTGLGPHKIQVFEMSSKVHN